MKTVLIVNPGASGVTPEVTAAVERALSASGEVDTRLTEGPGHATELARDASAACDRMLVLSGDGGYNEAVNGLVADVPMGFLAGGGTNVLPRALGLPRDPIESARAIAASTRTRRISLGRVVHADAPEGRRFTFAAGVGLDAELIRAGDEVRRRGSGRRPGDVAFARELGRIVSAQRGRFEPVLNVEGLGRAAAAFVANCDPYTYVGRLPIHVAPEARFELGLDLVAPVRIEARTWPKLAWWTLAQPDGRHSDELLTVHDADELRVICDRPLPLQIDGEDLGDVREVAFEAERDALDVLVG